MISISLCMIVKNEEDVLDRCLSSIKGIPDEIIIVDTGSTDRTKEIAYKFTDKVYDFTWIDDFAAARNYSFSKATKDFCMWLDADDIIQPKDYKELLELKNRLDKTTDIVMMKYDIAFDTNNRPTFSYYRERLISNNKGFVWESPIHEAITARGNIIYVETAVSHKKLKAGDPDRNLRIFEKMIAMGRTLDPRQQYYYGRELYYHKQYDKAAEILSAFLDAPEGWKENKIEACVILSHCYNAQGITERVLDVLLKSFHYDLPRAEVCCEIGKYFMDRADYSTAIFWLKHASTLKPENRSGGFILPDCYDYVPYLQLCVCFDKLGNKDQAIIYNEKAGKVHPHSKAYQYNKKYFSK